MAATANKQQHINFFKRSLEKAARPETFTKLINLVAPRVLPGKKNLIYVLYQVDRIGQLSGELLHVKTLFEKYYDRIIIDFRSLEFIITNILTGIIFSILNNF